MHIYICVCVCACVGVYLYVCMYVYVSVGVCVCECLLADLILHYLNKDLNNVSENQICCSRVVLGNCINLSVESD